MPLIKTDVVLSQTLTPITFDCETLKRIEDTTGETMQVIIDRFNDMRPKDKGDDGEFTPAAVRAAARKFSVGFAATFVAGAANLPLNQILPKDAMLAFNKLASPFIEAWNDLVSGENADPKADSGASTTSPPGPR